MNSVRVIFQVCPWSWWLADLFHDNVVKWKHFPCYWPFVRGIHQSQVNSPHKDQWHGALMFSLIWAWMNGWVYREAGDLRRHRAHDDVTVMSVWHKETGTKWPPVDRYFYILTHCDAEWRIYASVIQPWHHVIIWTNAGILLIGTLWTNFSEILIQIHTFWITKMHLKRVVY